MAFRDRTEAGRRLAPEVSRLGLDAAVVLALPRGGIPVAAEVAATLGAPLDVLVACKVGAPGREELGIGAVAEGLEQPIFSASARGWGAPAALDDLARAARSQVEDRARRYRCGRPPPELARRDVVLVDDGLATGITAEAALLALHRAEPRRLVLAVPVCAPEAADRLARLADEVVCVEAPRELRSVGMWYDDFSQVADDEALDLLARSRIALHRTARAVR